MIEDTFATVLCPVCVRSLDSISVKQDSSTGDSYTEYRRCPCGSRFSLEVVVEDAD